MDDALYIRRALRLAEKALGKTSPNPMVGAIIVKAGRIIAEDFHRKAGQPHAEALAILKAGNSAKGATLYVNLEPCCHTGKRTPPCTKAIIQSGIKKVVVSMLDPNPKVAGKGIKELKEAGIEVKTGAFEDEAKRLNEAYIKYITTKRPFVIMKVAMTLDGKIATPEGQSKWITGSASRRLVHKLRGSVDAIMTAIGTVKADDPELTARLGSKTVASPIRIVIDPELQIPINARILKTPPETIIVTKKENSSKTKKLEKSNIYIMKYKGKLDLKWLMERLALDRGVMSVLIEGGSSLNAHCLEDGVVDKVMFFIAPKIIGGNASFPSVGGRTFNKTLQEAYQIKDMKIRRIKEDILIEGYVEK